MAILLSKHGNVNVTNSTKKMCIAVAIPRTTFCQDYTINNRVPLDVVNIAVDLVSARVYRFSLTWKVGINLVRKSWGILLLVRENDVYRPSYMT